MQVEWTGLHHLFSAATQRSGRPPAAALLQLQLLRVDGPQPRADRHAPPNQRHFTAEPTPFCRQTNAISPPTNAVPLPIPQDASVNALVTVLPAQARCGGGSAALR